MMVASLADAAPPATPQASAAPQASRQTSRSQALKQMGDCQRKAKGLKGADKERSIQNCMRTPG